MSAKFEIKHSANGQYMFNLKAPNGEVILTSETYHQKRSAEEGIASVRANAGDDSRFERKVAKDGSPYFVLKARQRRSGRQERDVFIELGDGKRNSLGSKECFRGSDRGHCREPEFSIARRLICRARERDPDSGARNSRSRRLDLPPRRRCPMPGFRVN